MARVPPNRRRARWQTALRVQAPLLLVTGGLIALLAVALATGWVGWLADHPEQAWQWVVRHWFVPSALAVFVALLTAWVTWAGPRSQQRHAERLSVAERAWQEQRDQVQRTRQREEAAAAEQEAWAQRCRELLALWPLSPIEQVDPYHVGVLYSRRADAYRKGRSRPPYVPRAVDQDLAALLHAQPLVLVKGQSRAGKSRTAFEIAARELAGWRLLVPTDRAALAELGKLGRLPGHGQRVLLWLDDLDQYLASAGTRGLDAGLVNRLAARDPPAKVLATIRLEEHARLATTPGELGRAVRELLNRFDPGAITLPVGFEEPAERAGIAELYPGEQVSGGLAEHLAAARELVERLETGEASVPEGAGLVLAAVDWRRAGLDRPVGKAELVELLPLYLARLRPLMPLVREGEVDRGLGWATEPVGRTAALLLADPDPLAGTFRAADPVVDLVERRTGRRLSDPAVWERLLGQVSPEEAMEVGFVAYTRKERRSAIAAYQQVVDSGHADYAPKAAFNLARLLEDDRDAAGAQAAYQQAIDSGHPDHAPKAAYNLARLLEGEGDVLGARVAYQQATDSGHPDTAPRAADRLALLLSVRGDVADARAAFQQLVESGHPVAAARGAIWLASLLAQQGDEAGARAAFQRAIDSGEPDATFSARLGLARLLEEEGDVAGARALLQQAMDSADDATRHAYQAFRIFKDDG